MRLTADELIAVLQSLGQQTIKTLQDTVSDLEEAEKVANWINVGMYNGYNPQIANYVLSQKERVLEVLKMKETGQIPDGPWG